MEQAYRTVKSKKKRRWDDGRPGRLWQPLVQERSSVSGAPRIWRRVRGYFSRLAQQQVCFYFPVPAFGRAGDITTTHSVQLLEYILILILTDECKYNYRCIACLLEARLAPRWHGSSMAQRVFSVWGSTITSLGYPYATV